MSDCKALTIVQRPLPKYPWATDAEVLDALERNDYHVANTAREFGVPRHVLARRLEETPALVLALDDWRETLVDDAQGHYARAARSGNALAVQGVLNALGRNRGFGKQDDRGGAVIEVTVRQLSKE